MRALLLVDTRRRLIDNTPYDVLKLAASLRRRGWSVAVADLRHEPEDRTPCDADVVYLFLETAGTWMCFDWDEPRFVRRVTWLSERYRDVVVIGPQARAVQELVDRPIRIVTELAFEPIIDPAYDSGIAGDHDEIAATAGRYNGEHYDGSSYTLRPTVSLYHAMSCPMSCGFCFYARNRAAKTIPWPALAGDISALCTRGLEHFFFMDPNLLLDAEGEHALTRLRDHHPRFTYYCQVSPNALTERYVSRLRETGCHGMVIGIENAELIRSKGSLAGARRAVDRVIAAGMMPMLYFLVDGVNDVDPVAQQFQDVPFRYSVLNTAFHGERTLADIRTGFAARAELRSRADGQIVRLRASPRYLDRLADRGLPVLQKGVG